MKVVKTKRCCHEMGFNWLKGKMAHKAAGLFDTFTELVLFVFQACMLAPTPIRAPRWSCSALTPLSSPLPIYQPDNTAWTGTSAALITCRR